jgi:hypothetical protein
MTLRTGSSSSVAWDDETVSVQASGVPKGRGPPVGEVAPTPVPRLVTSVLALPARSFAPSAPSGARSNLSATAASPPAVDAGRPSPDAPSVSLAAFDNPDRALEGGAVGRAMPSWRFTT